MKKVYNKLVRDKIPSINEKNGKKSVIRTLNDEEYKLELERKLSEECQEVLSAQGKDRVEELADMLEIIKYLAKLEKATLEDVIKIAEEKTKKRGAFDKKIFLEKVIEQDIEE